MRVQICKKNCGVQFLQLQNFNLFSFKQNLLHIIVYNIPYFFFYGQQNIYCF